MNPDWSKKPIQSKGIWGGVTAAISGLVVSFNLNVGQDDVASWVAAIGSVVGGLLAVYGRWKADRVIK